ncbi:hypothetical protein BDY19DRAFT_987572 [Irpex rosettiformis]|uniref:Uncharacterized protein n=1 Tax=Irpex rosettiformis TaxID=378272 RepID=A0ACB8TQE6_9APHY|nr:hypothetical protein BDY19DRAFT_987572 [Irpex rosettiformis]
MSLVVWIAIHQCSIHGSLAYMDDNFGFDPDRALTTYKPYRISMPKKQAALLTLWDELPESSQLLVAAIREFVHNAPQRRRTLREWQQILGWINWGLNVQPLLKPALQSCYDKISQRFIPSARIYLNKRTTRDLLWIANRFEHYDGVYLLKAITWSPQHADVTVFCDASLSGLGFWSPRPPGFAFAADRPDAPLLVEDNIFWYEALTVLSALHWAVTLSPQPFRIAIFSDNLNTVQMFDSFRAKEPYLDILLSAVEILISQQVDLRVWHIPGERNTIADALSRQLFTTVAQYAPFLKICTFQPPQLTSGLCE